MNVNCNSHKPDRASVKDMSKAGKLFWGVFAVVIIVVGVLWMIKNPAPEHIEDTNGAENCTLTQITEEDVINATWATADN